MTFAIERDKVGREAFLRAELDLPRCANDYGVAPCTASGAAGGECYRTPDNCQDLPNYDGSGVNTITFCEKHVAIPGQPMLPLIVAADLRPASIVPGKALGRRAQITLTMLPYPTMFAVDDAILDPYWSTRTHSPQGDFWGKLKAIYPYYQSAAFRLISGYIANPYDPDDAVTFNYVLEEVDGPINNGRVTLLAKDVLKLADDKRAVCPALTTGSLTADMTVASTAAFTITDGAGQYDAAGYLALGDDIIQYTAGSDSGADFSVAGTITRNAYNTSNAASHSAGDSVQMCYELNDTNIVDFLDVLLFVCGNVPSSMKDVAVWAAEKSVWLTSVILNGLLSEPEGVTSIIEDLQKNHAAFYIWPDEQTQLIKLQAIAPPPTPTITWTDGDNLQSVKVIEQPDSRLTRVLVRYNAKTPLNHDDAKDFYGHHMKVDANAEDPIRHGDKRLFTALGRFLKTKALAVQFAGRKLARFVLPPKQLEVDVDARDSGVSIGDVIAIDTRFVPDKSGASFPTAMRVLARREVATKVSGTLFRYRLEDAVYKGRYARIMASSDSSSYGAASDSEKDRGCYIVSGTQFSDGEEGYQIL